MGKIHSDVIREKFDKHKDGQEGADLRNKYEDYAMRDLEFVIQQCSVFAVKELERIRKEPRNKRLPPEVATKIMAMRRGQTALAQKIALLDDDCEARQKLLLIEQSEELVKEMRAYEKVEEEKMMKTFKPLTCETCGAGYMETNEGEYETHLTFRVHDTYKIVREKLKEMQDKKSERDKLKRSRRTRKKSKETKTGKKAEKKTV